MGVVILGGVYFILIGKIFVLVGIVNKVGFNGRIFFLFVVFDFGKMVIILLGFFLMIVFRLVRLFFGGGDKGVGDKVLIIVVMSEMCWIFWEWG